MPGAGTGPTHLPLSTVAMFRPRATVLPGFFGVTAMMDFARFCATSVIPTVTRSPSTRAHTCLSIT